jgi:hypothetical protein
MKKCDEDTRYDFISWLICKWENKHNLKTRSAWLYKKEERCTSMFFLMKGKAEYWVTNTMQIDEAYYELKPGAILGFEDYILNFTH